MAIIAALSLHRTASARVSTQKFIAQLGARAFLLLFFTKNWMLSGIFSTGSPANDFCLLGWKKKPPLMLL
jgi:hypothetical protein